MSIFLYKGIIVGFSIGAVVGPIGILCLQKSITNGLFAGLAVGLGAALADATYAGIAAFGMQWLIDYLVIWQDFLRLFGGTYLMYLGIKTFFSKTPVFQENNSSNDSPKNNSSIADIISTFFLTLSSPVTILAFLALFSSFDLRPFLIMDSMFLTVGTFLGSMVWWLLLSMLGNKIKRHSDDKLLHFVNPISGIIVGLFGLVTLSNAIVNFIW